MAQDFFTDFELFTDEVLGGIANHERIAQKYKTTLGMINQLLLATHRMVISRVERVEQAATVEEARSILDELNWGPLTESFRVEGMCETFEGLGIALDNLLRNPESGMRFTAEQLRSVQQMAEVLTNREAEVSLLYLNRIQQLADLVTSTASNLDELKERARDAKAVLTHQMSDFDSKARRFLAPAGG